MIGRVVASWLLAGCNVVFGLDGTRRAIDPDEDGFDVGDDNCPAIANDQTDSDLDGVGDACDLCEGKTPTNHDEDGDGRGDDCDPCPAMVEFIQDDQDNDDIGDDCDDSDLGPKTQRIVFDPFVAIDPRLEGAEQWQIVNDSIEPKRTSNDRLHAQWIQLPGDRRYSIHIGLRAKRKWLPSDLFGIQLLSDDGTVKAECLIDCVRDPQMCTSVLRFAGGEYVNTVAPEPTVHLALQALPAPPGVQLTCGFVNGTRISQSSQLLTGIGTPAIISTPNLQVTYLELLTE